MPYLFWWLPLLLWGGAVTADQPVTADFPRIEVFTLNGRPIEANTAAISPHMDIQRYELDRIHLVEMRLSRDLLVDPRQAEAIVLDRFQNLDRATSDSLRQSAVGLAKSMQYGIRLSSSMIRPSSMASPTYWQHSHTTKPCSRGSGHDPEAIRIPHRGRSARVAGHGSYRNHHHAAGCHPDHQCGLVLYALDTYRRQFLAAKLPRQCLGLFLAQATLTRLWRVLQPCDHSRVGWQYQGYAGPSTS